MQETKTRSRIHPISPEITAKAQATFADIVARSNATLAPRQPVAAAPAAAVAQPVAVVPSPGAVAAPAVAAPSPLWQSVGIGRLGFVAVILTIGVFCAS